MDLDLIAAAFSHIQDLAFWLRSPAVRSAGRLSLRNVEANARAAVQSCVAQVSLSTTGASGLVGSSVRPSPGPVELKVWPRTKRKCGRSWKAVWPSKKLAASSVKKCWKSSLIDRLIEENSQLGASAKDWAVVSSLSPYLLEQRVSLHRLRLSSFSSSTLSAALTALRRRKAWCAENVESSVKPCAVHLVASISG